MPKHVPVLLRETLTVLDPKPGESVLDCTLGLGGHSEELLKRIGEAGSLVGLDADKANLSEAESRLSGIPGTKIFLHANFRDLPECLPEDQRTFDIILADLGLSSPHLDDPDRGFSFRGDGALDMRYDRTKGMTAAMLIASLDRTKLRDIFADYGEVPLPHRLVDALIKRRSAERVKTNADLVDAVNEVYGHKAKDHLSQIFQALRIAVNNEIDSLRRLLTVAPDFLKPGGRFAVMSYHSLEDRLTKQTFKDLATGVKDPVTGAVSIEADFELLTPRAVKPSDAEVSENPRSRSARLRAIRKKPFYTPQP